MADCVVGGGGSKQGAAAWRVGYGGKVTIGGRVGAVAAAAASADAIHLGSARPTDAAMTDFSAWRCCSAAFLCAQLRVLASPLLLMF